jgi:hypothetical protein
MAAAGSKAALRRARRGSLSISAAPLLSQSHLSPKVEQPGADITQLLGAGDTEAWYWVRDYSEGFALGKLLIENHDRTFVFELAGGREVVLPQLEVGPAVEDRAALLESFADMVKMVDVNEPNILHNLRQRFENDEIYTSIGECVGSIVGVGQRWVDDDSFLPKYLSLLKLSSGDAYYDAHCLHCFVLQVQFLCR